MGADIDTCRTLISIGVDAAFNAIGDTRTDRTAIVDAQMVALLRRQKEADRERRRAAYARHRDKNPQALRERNREAKRRQMARERDEEERAALRWKDQKS